MFSVKNDKNIVFCYEFLFLSITANGNDLIFREHAFLAPRDILESFGEKSILGQIWIKMQG